MSNVAVAVLAIGALLTCFGMLLREHFAVEQSYTSASARIGIILPLILGPEANHDDREALTEKLQKVRSRLVTISQISVHRAGRPPVTVGEPSTDPDERTFDAPLLTVGGNPPTGRVEFRVRREPFDNAFRSRAALLILLSVGLFTVLAAFFSFFVENALRRVVSGFSDHARALAGGPPPDRDFLEEYADFDELTIALRDAQRRVESLENRIEVGRHELEELSETRARFLANVSHEIRTPLAAIVGFAEMLNDETLDASRRSSYLETVTRNCRHLKLIVNDILDLSKIEAGGMTIESVPVVLADLMREIEEPARRRATAKGLTFNLDLDPTLPRCIKTDPTRFRQVLDNLIGNALKFTDEGGVRVETGCKMLDADHVELHFEVIDTGIGMETDQLERIFEPFVQADSSVTRRFGGTGLGLAISKQFAELMDGSLRAESTPQEGTRLCLTFRAPLVPDDDDLKTSSSGTAILETHANAAEGRAFRVLVIEDSPDNQLLVSLMLQRENISPDLANDGQEGIDKAAAAEAMGQPYDLIFLDMQMPVLDGYQTIAEMRRRALGSPVVALTAHAMSGDRDRCLQAGCDDFASKPMDRTKLLEILSRFGDRAEDEEE